VLGKEVEQVWTEHRRISRASKVWHKLQREGFRVARSTVERLMRSLGLAGAVRGCKVRMTIPDEGAARPVGLVERNFTATRANQLWVADLPYVATWGVLCT